MKISFAFSEKKPTKVFIRIVDSQIRFIFSIFLKRVFTYTISVPRNIIGLIQTIIRTCINDICIIFFRGIV